MIIACPGSEKAKVTEQLAALLEPLERAQLVGERNPGPVFERPIDPDGGVGWPRDVSVTVVVHELGSPMTTVEGKHVRLVEVALGVAWIWDDPELAEWVASPRYSPSIVTVSTAEGLKLTEQLADVIDPTRVQDAVVKEPAPLVDTLTVPDGAMVAPSEVSVTITPHKLDSPTATGELHDRVVDVSVTTFTSKLVELERARGLVPVTLAVYVPAGAEPVATSNVDFPGVRGATNTI
jgi:hypothetical protein